MDRKFKGIWIPKEIWENKELSILEKVILVEIDSLEDEKIGCFASNKYFAEFFGLTNGRISQIISDLKERNYIKVNYEYEGKEIQKRTITINRPPYPKVFNKLNRYLENDKGGIKFSKEGYLENDKDNNIINNNININNKKEYFLDSELNEMFLDFLKMRKKMKAVNSDRAINGLLNILNKYDDETKKEMINNSIVNSWKSVYELKKPILEKTPKRENNQKVIEKEPQWMDKDYDDDIMSDEELAEFERQLRGEK